MRLQASSKCECPIWATSKTSPSLMCSSNRERRSSRRLRSSLSKPRRPRWMCHPPLVASWTRFTCPRGGRFRRVIWLLRCGWRARVMLRRHLAALMLARGPTLPPAPMQPVAELMARRLVLAVLARPVGLVVLAQPVVVARPAGLEVLARPVVAARPAVPERSAVPERLADPVARAARVAVVSVARWQLAVARLAARLGAVRPVVPQRRAAARVPVLGAGLVVVA